MNFGERLAITDALNSSQFPHDAHGMIALLDALGALRSNKATKKLFLAWQEGPARLEKASKEMDIKCVVCVCQNERRLK